MLGPDGWAERMRELRGGWSLVGGKRALAGTAAAVTATAVGGAIAVDADSGWYRRLDKPQWQPPSWSFGAVWTPLYGLIAVAGARVLQRADAGQRRAFLRAYTADLALNAAWNPLFFRLRAPRLALAELVALNAANAVLLREAYRVDRLAAAALLPYVAWTGFATALNASIARRNGNASIARRNGNAPIARRNG